MLESLKTQRDLHLPRKIFHVTMILGILACMVFFDRATCWKIYLFLGVPVMAIDFSRSYLPALNRVFLKVVGPFLRKHETRQVSGASFAILGIGICYALFPLKISQIAVLFLAVGDPTASFFGVLFGKKKLWGDKSEAGVLACVLICIFASFLFFNFMEDPIMDSGQWLWVCPVLGLFGGLAEIVPMDVDDNLSQPLVSGTLIYLFFSFAVAGAL